MVSNGGGKSGGTSTSNIQGSLNAASTIATTLFTGAAITINVVNTTLLPIANANGSVIGVTVYWGINIRPVENTLGMGMNKLILKNTRLFNKITKISKVVGTSALITDVGISTWNNFTNDDLAKGVIYIC